MTRRDNDISDVASNAVMQFFVNVRRLLSASDKFERFLPNNFSTIITLLVVVVLALISRSHTQSIYEKKIAAEERLRSAEAQYSRSKEAYHRATLSSFISDEIERRKIDIEQSKFPTIVIE